jgi:hypothetical protein
VTEVLEQRHILELVGSADGMRVRRSRVIERLRNLWLIPALVRWPSGLKAAVG